MKKILLIIGIIVISSKIFAQVDTLPATISYVSPGYTIHRVKQDTVRHERGQQLTFNGFVVLDKHKKVVDYLFNTKQSAKKVTEFKITGYKLN